MKIVVDWDLCESNAICVEVCPEIFSVDENEYLIIASDSPDESLRERVEQAVRSCPRQAISIED